MHSRPPVADSLFRAERSLVDEVRQAMSELRVELGELWRSVSREMHERLKAAFREVEFSPATVTLLRRIHRVPGVNVGQLARHAGTVKSHVSKLVEQLVAQGLVEKRSDPDDQRLVRLYLTQAADEMRAQMEARMQTAWAGIVEEIPEDELESVVSGLRQIQRAMTELMQGRTSFVIAHRLSTVRDANLILVMDHGAVIEQGTHQELLERGGFYADLYNSQFAGLVG